MSDHSPGPWTLADENNRCCSVLLSTEHNLTASLDRQDLNTGEFVIDRREMIANARLIAAAPDLLEALQMAVHLYEEYGLVSGMTVDGVSAGHWVNKAREAIDKSTGDYR